MNDKHEIGLKFSDRLIEDNGLAELRETIEHDFNFHIESCWCWYEPAPESLIGFDFDTEGKRRTLVAGWPDFIDGERFSELMVLGSDSAVLVIPAETGGYRISTWSETGGQEAELVVRRSVSDVYTRNIVRADKKILHRQFGLHDDTMPERIRLVHYRRNNRLVAWTLKTFDPAEEDT